MSDRPNAAAANAAFELGALEDARHYREALVAEFRPHLQGAVVELGAGSGSVSELLARVPGLTRLLAVEPDAGFARQLRARLPGLTVLRGTTEALRPGPPWNALVSVNVLEHIRDDDRELARQRALLAPARGVLCLFVPARPELYAPIDRDFGHFRRYTKAGLRRQLGEAGFDLLRLDYFNLVGYFGWWLTFRVLGQRTFNPAAVRFFDRVVFPLVHAFESRLARPPVGQSLLATARARA